MDTNQNETRAAGELQNQSLANRETLSRDFQPAMIDRLFGRLTMMYGNKFLDMWASSPIEDVKKCWSDELRIFSVEQIGLAVSNLKTHNFPPTLPEFLQLCESARRERPRSSPTPLPDKRGYNPNDPAILAAKARCMETVAKLHASMGNPFSKPSNNWANKILARHEAGEVIPPDSLRMARTALGGI